MNDRAKVSNKDRLLAMFDSEYSPWVAIGQRIGAAALDVVLEELGGTKPHVPMQGTFWRGLERVVLRESIRHEHGKGGKTVQEVADSFGMTYRQTHHILFEKAPVKTCRVSDDRCGAAHQTAQAMGDA